MNRKDDKIFFNSNNENLLRLQGITIKNTKKDNQSIIEVELERKAIKYPCCKHKTIIVFNDTKGHIQVKCRKCKREIMMNIV